MALLSKEDILGINDRKFVEVAVPEWGGSVLVRSLTGRERDEFEASTVETKGNKASQNFVNFRARLVSLCIVDENKQRMFKTRSEIDALGNKSVAALQRVFNKCQELNGLSDEDVDELTESFDEAPDEASTSD